MSRIVALGDSHLQRLGARADELAAGADRTVVNVAVGGSRTAELAEQIAAAGVGQGDRVVVSIGTNDAASWYPLPLAESVDHLGAALLDLASRGAVRVLLVTTPGVDRTRLPMSNDGTEGDLREHARAYASLAHQHGIEVVDAAELLSDLGPAAAFVDDGLHLSQAAYDRLLPVLASALGG